LNIKPELRQPASASSIHFGLWIKIRIALGSIIYPCVMHRKSRSMGETKGFASSTLTRYLFVIAVASLLAACGGGSGVGGLPMPSEQGTTSGVSIGGGGSVGAEDRAHQAASIGGGGSVGSTPVPSVQSATNGYVGLPRPDHVVVVIEENHGYSQIVSDIKSSPYIHELMTKGVLFTQSYGVTHPSQPNYLALFSGDTQNVTDDSCPHTFNTDNLAKQLLNAGLSFAIFSEDLPFVGDMSCMSGGYQLKHNPMVNWQGTQLPPEMNKRFADFTQDFAQLPTVSFVIPNQDNDMHDGSIEAADNWLKIHIGPYVDWAYEHNSLLILTWDEDDFMGDNRIVTIMVGPMVNAGTSAQRINHYNVLRTLLELNNLPAIGESKNVEVIKDIWLTH